MSFQLFQLLLGLLHLNSCRCGDTHAGGRWEAMLSALEGAASFLEEQYSEINLDAVLGYCLQEAYIGAALEKWDSEPEVHPERDRVAQLKAKVSDLTEKARRSVERADPIYYREFGPVLAPGFWKLPHRWVRLNTSAAFAPTSGPCLQQADSDVCLSALLGTRKHQEETCLVLDGCRPLETKTHCSDYSLSHQLFYFLHAEMLGCQDPLFRNTPYYKNVFCRLMMQRNLRAEKEGQISSMRDLFTENILFCGLAGFPDFYKPEWLDLILSWQKPEKGCFWMYEPETPVSGQHAPKPRRVKRREKILQDGCSSHNTAVGVAAIGGFLYYNS